jgi:hypothetical protein
MLGVDLGRVAREGSVLVEASVPADDKLWEDSGIDWNGPVEVRLRASFAGSGEIVVRGTVRGELRQECRRCLRPVKSGFEEDLTLVFVEGDGDTDSGEGDEFVFDPTRGELDRIRTWYAIRSVRGFVRGAAPISTRGRADAPRRRSTRAGRRSGR